MAQAKGKYWLAGHSDSEITYDEVKELATISETDFGVVSDLTASAAEINANCDVLTETVTTTNIIAASETGTHFVLNTATAFVSTLPTPAAGLEFWFHAGATQVTGGNHTIVTNGSANIIVGVITTSADGTAVSCTADSDTISFKDGAAKHGDYCHVWSDGTNWYLTGSVVAAGGATVTQAS